MTNCGRNMKIVLYTFENSFQILRMYKIFLDKNVWKFGF